MRSHMETCFNGKRSLDHLEYQVALVSIPRKNLGAFGDAGHCYR